MANAREKGLGVSRAFLRDLKTVFEADASDDVPLEDLNALDRKLKQSGEKCRRRLNKLEDDHPIRCEFGLFGPMGLGRREVSHTRALAWLLKRDAEHGFGDTLLAALMKHIGLDHPISKALVVPERFCRDLNKDQLGRTDIWIEGNGEGRRWLVVIEAKIDAGEGEQQLSRYDKGIELWARSRGCALKDIRKVFLAPPKKLPDQEAAGWRVVSFADLAGIFLREADALKKQPGYAFLRLYLAGLLSDVIGLAIGKKGIKQNPHSLAMVLEDNRGASARTKENR